MAVTNRQIADTILRFVTKRGPGKTCCPSEIARALGKDGDWRALMEPVRHVAAELADAGQVVITQGGQAVDPTSASGPIRLGLRK